MNKPMHEHTLRNKHTWNCNQYFSSGAFFVGKHVSNVINHRDKCMVMVGKTAREFPFCFHILAKTRNDPAKPVIKEHLGLVEVSNHFK